MEVPPSLETTLRHLCSVQLTLRPPSMIGEGPSGQRVIAEIEAMSLKGDRLQAELEGSAAADWLTIANKVAKIDVRATLRTHDGALIYLRYKGRSDVKNGLGSSPIVVAPTFETSDERYLWLNAVQAVGKGDLALRRYEWFEVQ
ncbi:DUF3237 domain-containing protein [Congregibacter brevis]|uniref:DUF3237 domain-containing protein n=1 Tax=Congregibacter brevis TaxID=3081201 RepID=A0ABZ0IB32_9GAMM|nr:DUF3237 domain-containing protein [Congregibacter sp. IMCC45268]